MERGAAADELRVIVGRLAELRGELHAVDRALAAGEAAEDGVLAVAKVDLLSTTGPSGRAATAGGHDYAEELRMLHRHLRDGGDTANGLLEAFRAALGVPSLGELPTHEGRSYHITSEGARPEYEALWTQITGVVEAVGRRLTELRTRRTDLALAIATLDAERVRLTAASA